MLFNSYIFIFLMLPVTLIGYYFLNHIKQYKAGLCFLLGMSFWFIGYMNWMYLLILLPSILVNYYVTWKMHSIKDNKRKKILLIIGILLNLLLLFVFKYYDFFLENANRIFVTDFSLLQIFLPLGISFYTFKQITYLVDCYRNPDISYDLLSYATYVSFFPQFIQGPIVLQGEMIPQFFDKDKKIFSYDEFAKGLYLFSIGLGKKVLLADNLAKIVNSGYGNIEELNSPSAILTMFAYTLQIYFDFSGYCDMAIGISQMFRIDLPINFDSPYKATSIDEFWDRWHITLTRFFTRYVYIPLGGSRKGMFRTYINVFLIFLLSGIWHGAAWTFILWGVLHGVAMLVSRTVRLLKIQIPKVIGLITTFLFVNVAWVFFRADTIQDAFLLLRKMVTGGFGSIDSEINESISKVLEVSLLERVDVLDIFERLPGIYSILFVSILTFICLFTRNSITRQKQMKLTVFYGVLTIILLFYCILSLSGISEFIYFNF